jgi:hypothetical protein
MKPKPPRSALPLPRYVDRKPLKSRGWAYYFNVPSLWRKAGCPVKSGPLGSDYDVQRWLRPCAARSDGWRLCWGRPGIVARDRLHSAD